MQSWYYFNKSRDIQVSPFEYKQKGKLRELLSLSTNELDENVLFKNDLDYFDDFDVDLVINNSQSLSSRLSHITNIDPLEETKDLNVVTEARIIDRFDYYVNILTRKYDAYIKSEIFRDVIGLITSFDGAEHLCSRKNNISCQLQYFFLTKSLLTSDLKKPNWIDTVLFW